MLLQSIPLHRSPQLIGNPAVPFVDVRLSRQKEACARMLLDHPARNLRDVPVSLFGPEVGDIRHDQILIRYPIRLPRPASFLRTHELR